MGLLSFIEEWGVVIEVLRFPSLHFSASLWLVVGSLYTLSINSIIYSDISTHLPPIWSHLSHRSIVEIKGWPQGKPLWVPSFRVSSSTRFLVLIIPLYCIMYYVGWYLRGKCLHITSVSLIRELTSHVPILGLMSDSIHCLQCLHSDPYVTSGLALHQVHCPFSYVLRVSLWLSKIMSKMRKIKGGSEAVKSWPSAPFPSETL